jgi:hypothetical protein
VGASWVTVMNITLEADTSSISFKSEATEAWKGAQSYTAGGWAWDGTGTQAV